VILLQEPKNPRGNQRKGGRASAERAFKEPIQLPHCDGEKEDRQVKSVCRLHTDQYEVSEGCVPNAPHKLHPR